MDIQSETRDDATGAGRRKTTPSVATDTILALTGFEREVGCLDGDGTGVMMVSKNGAHCPWEKDVVRIDTIELKPGDEVWFQTDSNAKTEWSCCSGWISVRIYSTEKQCHAAGEHDTYRGTASYIVPRRYTYADLLDLLGDGDKWTGML